MKAGLFLALALMHFAPAADETPAPAPRLSAAVPCSLSMTPTATPGVSSFRHCVDTPEMIPFRGGTYAMGDAVGNGMSYERPVHEVTIAPFAIGRFELTQHEWQHCVDAGACTLPQGAPPELAGRERYPVIKVSWRQARAYVQWLATRTDKPYRLPTEAEWEYAARAGTTGQFPWGSQELGACIAVNFFDRAGHRLLPALDWWTDCDDGYATTAPVGSYPPNAWGVHDMLGNVWEWVEDCWHPSYANAPDDGSAWIDGGDCRKRVNRGGGWGNAPSTLRLSNRDADPAEAFSDGLGLRVALSLAPTKR